MQNTQDNAEIKVTRLEVQWMFFEGVAIGCLPAYLVGWVGYGRMDVNLFLPRILIVVRFCHMIVVVPVLSFLRVVWPSQWDFTSLGPFGQDQHDSS